MSKFSDGALFKGADLLCLAANNFERATSLAKAGRMIDSHCVGAVGKCQFAAGRVLGGFGLWLERIPS